MGTRRRCGRRPCTEARTASGRAWAASRLPLYRLGCPPPPPHTHTHPRAPGSGERPATAALGNPRSISVPRVPQDPPRHIDRARPRCATGKDVGVLAPANDSERVKASRILQVPALPPSPYPGRRRSSFPATSPLVASIAAQDLWCRCLPCRFVRGSALHCGQSEDISADVSDAFHMDCHAFHMDCLQQRIALRTPLWAAGFRARRSSNTCQLNTEPVFAAPQLETALKEIVQVCRGLQLQHPMKNPYCSCKLTRIGRADPEVQARPLEGLPDLGAQPRRPRRPVQQNRPNLGAPRRIQLQ